MNASRLIDALLELNGGYSSPGYYAAVKRLERAYRDPLWLIEVDSLSSDPFGVITEHKKGGIDGTG